MNKKPGADCDNCPLALESCIGEPYNPGARFIAITQAPSVNDIFQGGVHTTDATKLFQKVLNFNGIPKTDFNYIPVVQCSGFYDLNLTEKTRAVRACSKYVLDYVENTGAEACLSLGPDATLQAMGTRGWASVRPGPARVRGGSLTLPVVPTASPQLCMVQQDKFPFLVTDVSKLVNEAPKFVAPDYNVITTEQQALDYLNWVLDQPEDIFTVDIETASEKDLAFENPEKFEMLCIGVKYADTMVQVFAEASLTKEVYVLLKSVMLRNRVLAHNGKFDLGGLRPHIQKVFLFFDTMLASYIFDERSGVHGLKYLAAEFLGAPDWDSEIKQYVGVSKNFGLVPKDILHKYNAYDVHCTYLLHLMYETRFENAPPELHDAYELLISASNMLQDVEHNGFAIDEEYLGPLSEKFVRDTDISRRNLAYQALTLSEGVLFDVKMGFNPNSPIQVKEFFASVGIKIDSTDADTLGKIINYDGDVIPRVVRDFAKGILDHRSKIKLGKTYIEGTKQRLYKGRIHPNYLLHGTTTGRLSCRNPNLQNIPRKSPIKRMFIPSGPGRILINVDYSQAELRVLSWLSGDSYFTPIFNEGIRDPFDELVPVLYPDAESKEEMDKDVWKENRTMVKTYVYGLGYGRTEYGIARGFGIDVDLARSYMDRFFAVIPEIREWQERTKQAVMDGEDLVTAYGRHRRYNLITKANKDNVMNEALAFLPQSTASDMTLTSAIEAQSTLRLQFDTKIVNLVHDAVMLDAPEKVAEEVIEYMERKMIQCAQRVVGDFVKFAVSSSYGNSWEELT